MSPTTTTRAVWKLALKGGPGGGFGEGPPGSGGVGGGPPAVGGVGDGEGLVGALDDCEHAMALARATPATSALSG